MAGGEAGLEPETFVLRVTVIPRGQILASFPEKWFQTKEDSPPYFLFSNSMGKTVRRSKFLVSSNLCSISIDDFSITLDAICALKPHQCMGIDTDQFLS